MTTSLTPSLLLDLAICLASSVPPYITCLSLRVPFPRGPHMGAKYRQAAAQVAALNARAALWSSLAAVLAALRIAMA